MMELTRDNYHTPAADAEYLSWHQYQDWMECPARTAAELAGEDPGLFQQYKHGKACFLVGEYVHLGIGEPGRLPAFVEAHADDIFKKAKGAKGEKYAEFAAADLVIEKARRDPEVAQMLAVGKPEQIVTGLIGGAAWKIRADLWCPDAGLFADWKTASGFDPYWDTGAGPKGARVPWYYGYWGQVATYSEVLRQAFGERPAGYIVGLAKPTPSMPASIQIVVFDDAPRIEACMEKVAANIPQVLRWKSGEDARPACGRCWWCAIKQPARVERAEWYG